MYQLVSHLGQNYRIRLAGKVLPATRDWKLQCCWIQNGHGKESLTICNHLLSP